MWIVSIFLFYLVSCLRINCSEVFIDILRWNNFVNGDIFNNVLIGEVQYNTFKDFIFCFNTCYGNANLNYPSGQDYPKVFIDLGDLTLKVFDASKLPEVKQNMEDRINNKTFQKNFVVENALSWYYTKNMIFLSQVALIWNKEKTYIIIIVEINGRVLNTPYIKLGRGLGTHFISNEIPQPGSIIYEISSRKVIRIGCLDMKGITGSGPFSLTMNPTYLSNMGGEYVVIQGPCLSNESSQNFVFKIYNNKAKENVIETTITVFNETESTLYFIMPLVWHPGIYTFELSYNSHTFLTETEIYSSLDSNQTFDLIWKDQHEMNNPNFSMRFIEIKLKNNFGLNPKYKFNIFNLTNVKDFLVPQKTSYDLHCINDQNGCITVLDSVKLDIYNCIGFFSISSTNGTTSWSAPFTLVLIRSFVERGNGQYKSNDKECKNFLSKNQDFLNSSCPDFSIKAQFLFSRFQRLTFPENFPIFNVTNQDCYVEIASGFGITKEKSLGVTCCYKKDGSLIYGQDYYLNNDTSEPSYAWNYSPLVEPFKHFLYDRLPMMSCCIFINNPELCSQYWESRNIISSADSYNDYAGNVFGDPHLMTFNNNVTYSFLSRGEYWLMKGKDDKFNLQGRFYSNLTSQSILKEISFRANSITVNIGMRRFNATLLDWNIKVQEELITTLPYSSKGITIMQETRDTKRLLIYINITGTYFNHMELTRLYYQQPFNEYINFKIYVSHNFQSIQEGGILGIIEEKANSSGLYKKGVNESVILNANDKDYFEFCKSWQLQSSSESLFSYESEEEFRIINSLETFSPINTFNVTECASNRFCNIDKALYGENGFSQITLVTYNEREQYNFNVKNIKYEKRRSCGHPLLPFVRLDSDSYEEGSRIKIIGCIDPKLEIKNKDQLILCENSTFIWTPNIDKDICIKKNDPEPGISLANIIAPSVALVLIIFIVVAIVLYFKIYRKKNPSVMKSELSMTSQDPLHSSTNTRVDEIYDTWSPTSGGDEYGVYSHIKKPTNVN